MSTGDAPAPSRLGLLLFPEVCLLAALAGILALRDPAPALLLLALVWLLDLPRTRNLARTLCLVAACVCAFGYAALREPAPAPVPDWLTRAAYPAQDGAGELRPPAAVRLAARVLRCDPLPGGRARILLTDIAPADKGLHGEARPAYGGRLVWTWHHPAFLPLPEQRLEAELRVAPQRGFSNPGVLDTERYWHDRGVRFRAWSGGKARVAILPEGEQGLLSALAGKSAQIRQSLKRAFEAALPGGGDTSGMRTAPKDGAAILNALIFADRSGITQEQSELFARSTLAHSLALSGLHLGFAVMAGWALAWSLGRFWPGLWLRMPRPKLAVLLSLPFAALYIWLGQAPISLLRAACMLAFWAFLLLLGRPRVLLDGLFAALALLLLWKPLALFELGLQLSALCVTVIALGLPGITGLAARLFPASREAGRALPLRVRFCRGALTLLGISLCIQVALLPVVLRAFGTSGLLFPLNLLWLPVLGTLVLPLAFLGLLACALGLASAAALFLHAAALPCDALLHLLSALERSELLLSPLMPRPHWLCAAGFWLLCLTLPALFSALAKKARPLRPGTLLFPLAAMLMLLLPPGLALLDKGRSSVRLRLLDVGMGQAALLEWNGLGRNKAHGRVLIDGGGFASASFDAGKALVAPALTDNALPRLTAAVNSHPDADHLSGLLFILEEFSLGAYYGNGGRPSQRLGQRESGALARNGLEKKRLSAGDVLELAPDLRLETLWPPAALQETMADQAAVAEKGNNASLIQRLVWRGVPLLLLCGDAEQEALRDMLQSPLSPAARVLVLPHHGAASSLAPGFYASVAPSLALVSAGFGNRWGFPSRSVREALAERGVPLLSTADAGQIVLEWTDPKAMPTVETARGD